MSRSLDIRRYQAADEDLVVELWRRCQLVRPANNPRLDIARKLRVDPDLFLVGVLDGELVGTVMAGYEGHRGWINYLAVAPELRGRGFGRLLVAEVEQRLRERGCPKINLQVRAENRDAIAFYERLGFIEDHVVSLGKRLEQDPPLESHESLSRICPDKH
jgi:ribosomal protein S18 acetylase RimI-like enzyme